MSCCIFHFGSERRPSCGLKLALLALSRTDDPWHQRKVCHVKILPHVASPSSKTGGFPKMPSSRTPTSWSKTWVSPLVSVWAALIGWPCMELLMAMESRHLPTQLAQSRHFAEGKLEAAMLEAFLQTELLQQSSGLPLWASGACVTAAAVSPTSIVVANCGDCRCVLEEQGLAQELSSDHNVQNATPEELRRVLAAGGTITPDKRVTIPGAPGRLATTRAFGDAWAKQQAWAYPCGICRFARRVWHELVRKRKNERKKGEERRRKEKKGEERRRKEKKGEERRRKEKKGEERRRKEKKGQERTRKEGKLSLQRKN
eukprot:Skav218817  [mRNA]  locus=scaffold1140:503539:509521:- [translate_table: standard]